MANKWATKLRKIEGAVVERIDPFNNVLRTPSPSVNFIFGNTHGLPLGYSMLLWGPPGGGKSLLSNAIIGHLHQTDPEAIVIKFDTEFRSRGQLNDSNATNFGVDMDRLIIYEVSKPGDVFDRIEQEIAVMAAEGAPIKLIIIDSINGVQGRREAVSESIDKMTIGDHAQTVQIGLKKVLPVQRKYGISLIVVAQQRSQLDKWEVMRGNTTKAAVSHGTQHHCEYFVYVEKNATKAGRTDELGGTFEDESRKDISNSAEQTGHKVRVWMQKSSFGGAGRTGEFTLDYKRGIVNQHEEVFRLGLLWGIIERLNAQTFVINEQRFVGKPKCLEALAASVELQQYIVNGLLEAEKKKTIRVSGHVAEDASPEDIEAAFGTDPGAD
jgi:RecA/RadA recombinase